jgi:hypothetical protein
MLKYKLQQKQNRSSTKEAKEQQSNGQARMNVPLRGGGDLMGSLLLGVW